MNNDNNITPFGDDNLTPNPFDRRLKKRGKTLSGEPGMIQQRWRFCYFRSHRPRREIGDFHPNQSIIRDETVRNNTTWYLVVLRVNRRIRVLNPNGGTTLWKEYKVDL